MLKSVLIYIVCFAVSITLFSIRKKINNRVARNLLFLGAMVPPILLSTFRYGVGTDYWGYKESYNQIAKSINGIDDIFSYYQEPLHVIFNIIAKKIFGSYIGFLFLASTVFIFFSYEAINRYEKEISPTLAYLIFFTTIFSLSLNCTRQMIAVSIVFYAYKYIYNRELLKYVFAIILASLFHKSAIICLLLYFIWIDKGKKNKKFVLFAAIFTILTPFLSSIIRSIGESAGIYIKYLNDYKATTTYGFLLYILPLLVLLLLNKTVIKEKGSEIQFYLRLYILQIPFQMLGNYTAFADRLAMFLLPSQIILFPLYLTMLKKNKFITKMLIVAWYIFYYFILFVIMGSNGVYPYNFI